MAMQACPVASEISVRIVAGEEKFTAPLFDPGTAAVDVKENRFAVDQGDNHVIGYERNSSGRYFQFPLQRKIII